MDEKILKKFLAMLDKGYDKNYCLSRFPAYEKELSQYIDLHLELGSLKTITPDPNYFDKGLKSVYKKISEEESNSIELRTQKIRSKKSPAKLRFLKPSIVFLSVFILLTFSFAGTTFASQKSLPGESLYGMKKTVEVIQLKITPYSKKGEFHLMLLNRRLYEANEILNKSDTKSEIVIKLLNDIDFQYKKCNEFMSINMNNKEQIDNAISNIKNRCRMKFDGVIDKASNQVGYTTRQMSFLALVFQP
jgi:hypothetical protein